MSCLDEKSGLYSEGDGPSAQDVTRAGFRQVHSLSIMVGWEWGPDDRLSYMMLSLVHRVIQVIFHSVVCSFLQSFPSIYMALMLFLPPVKWRKIRPGLFSVG